MSRFQLPIVAFISLIALTWGGVPQHPLSLEPPRPASNGAAIFATGGGHPLRLALVGDLHGDGSIAASITAFSDRRLLDGLVLLGDTFGGCGSTSLADPQWQSLLPVLELGLPVYPVLGNHEYGNPQYRLGLVGCGNPDPASLIEASSRRPSWHMPGRNYVIRFDGGVILMVDTVPVALNLDGSLLGSSTRPEIERWMKRELASETGWRIVVGHHAIYGSGVTRLKNSYVNQNMRSFGELLARLGVDAYISGHQHHLELIGDDEGPLYVISGAASRPARVTWQQSRPHPTRFTTRSPERGFAVLEVDSKRLAVSFHDVDGDPLTRNFVIHRSPETVGSRENDREY